MGLRESSTTQLLDVAPSVAPGDWRNRLRAAVYALCREPEGRATDAGAEALADLIDEGRAEPSAPASVTRVTAEALGAAIFHELRRGAGEAGRSESELVPPLMYSAVLPYRGPDSAADELRIPPPHG